MRRPNSREEVQGIMAGRAGRQTRREERLSPAWAGAEECVKRERKTDPQGRGAGPSLLLGWRLLLVGVPSVLTLLAGLNKLDLERAALI